MSNHFHILCKVPQQRRLSDQELLDCIELNYGRERRTQVAEQLAAYAKEESLSDQAQQLTDHYVSRLFDISIFMKELKGRFAQWYNRRHRRYGVLWAERCRIKRQSRESLERDRPIVLAKAVGTSKLVSIQLSTCP
jgi:putative transposase